MAKVRVPSLQHLARNWRDTTALTQKTLVRLAKNPPTFNYNALYGAIDDLLILRQPYDEIIKGIQKIRRPDLRKNFLEVLPLIRDHFDGVEPDYVLKMRRSQYGLRNGVLIPFDPPLIYGVGGQVIFPWFSFWRSTPLAGKRLSLFVTIVEEMMLQDPDLEQAKFQILDFSIPASQQPRTLKVIDAAEILRLDRAEKEHMLGIFSDALVGAQRELSGIPEKNKPATNEGLDTNQLLLF